MKYADMWQQDTSVCQSLHAFTFETWHTILKSHIITQEVPLNQIFSCINRLYFAPYFNCPISKVWSHIFLKNDNPHIHYVKLTLTFHPSVSHPIGHCLLSNWNSNKHWPFKARQERVYSIKSYTKFPTFLHGSLLSLLVAYLFVNFDQQFMKRYIYGLKWTLLWG